MSTFAPQARTVKQNLPSLEQTYRAHSDLELNVREELGVDAWGRFISAVPTRV